MPPSVLLIVVGLALAAFVGFNLPVLILIAAGVLILLAQALS